MKELLDISEYLGMPLGASAHAAELDYMMALVHWLMLVLFIIWAPYFLYVLYRFRRSKQPTAVYGGTKSRASTFLEGGVVFSEVALLFGFALPIWSEIRNERPTAPETTEVHVVAEQFAWNIHYPGPDGVFGRKDPALIDLATNPLGLDRNDPAARDDVTTLNELHLPAGRPALVHLSSKDVIHSFALQEMRVKQDVIPGLNLAVWFTPTRAGEYEIACAQLCGIGHYRMRGYVTVHTPEAFEAWLQEAGTEQSL